MKSVHLTTPPPFFFAAPGCYVFNRCRKGNRAFIDALDIPVRLIYCCLLAKLFTMAQTASHPFVHEKNWGLHDFYFEIVNDICH